VSRADYLEGLVLAAALLGLVLAAAGLAIRRSLPQLTGAARWVAFGTLGTLALVAAHVLPLALGVLTRGTVLVAAALLVAGAVALPRREGVPAAPAPPPVAPTGRLSAALAVAGVGAVAAAALAVAARDATQSSTGLDMVNFHLPDVARWIQSGSLWEVNQFVPGLTHGNYPNNGDTVLLAAALPWRNDFAVRVSMLPFLALTGLAVYALARELRAPAGAAALAGAAIAAVPIVAETAVTNALPDPVMWAGFAAGLLFLVRWAREPRASELALAGAGLGLAFGAKWYGVWAVVIVVAVWVTGSLAARRGVGRVARATAALAAIVAVTGGIWLVRNWVESGNPAFPVEVRVLGATVFAAPHDRLREEAGFTISGYLGDWPVWREHLLPTYRDFLGAPALLLAAGGLLGALLAAVALAGRAARTRSTPGDAGAQQAAAGVLGLGADRGGPGAEAPAARAGGRDGAEAAVAGLGAAGVLLAVAYALTPYSAQGAAGLPVFAGPNTRYLVPALLALAPAAAWAAGRLAGRAPLAARLAEAAVLAAVLLGLREAFDAGTARVAAWAAVLALAAGAAVAAYALRGRLPKPRLRLLAACAAGLALAGAGAVGWREQRHFNEHRYRGVDATFDWLLAHAPSGRRVALAGDWSNGVGPPFPMFGPRLRNQVAYNGPWEQRMLQRHRGPRPFLRALRNGRYDLLVVGRGFLARPGAPPAGDVPEERWARAGGLRQVARSDTLTLFTVD
jgi:hypothetical protein